MLNKPVKFVCIHAHFYQPPRENPWTQEIEIQESAAPYKNWNKRITDECYAPNARARILDKDLRIRKIVNNYSMISFNFGPTLLGWLEARSPEVYQSILEADQESQNLYSGHGSAMAQPYNHMIMPLANSRDKLTQIIWGIEDFKYRFNRNPEGMWLPEAAVDMETLDLLAQEGIRFTILAPHQAKQVRANEGSKGTAVNENTLDTSRPYKLKLPSGRTLAIFFYNNGISHKLAFGNLLSNGDNFYNNLKTKFSSDASLPELVHVATDGETYGHHHKFGDMTLAYVLDRLQNHEAYSLTNYSEFLERHPPVEEVDIHEDTSWSCAHGIERWRSNCGCHTGGREDWSQSWRKPLRESLDWLRNKFEKKFEEELKPLVKDPWAARNDYIHLLQSSRDFDGFFSKQCFRNLSEKEKTKFLKWMEVQRHAMLMYTSCGWFFNDISGIETEQILRYASFSLELYSKLGEPCLEVQFLEILKNAQSNIPKWKDGKNIYEKMVESNKVSPEHIFSCGLLTHLLRKSEEPVAVAVHRVNILNIDTLRSGESELIFGKGEVVSTSILENVLLQFYVVHSGDEDFKIFLSAPSDKVEDGHFQNKISSLFRSAGYPETLEILVSHFGAPIYPSRNIFHNHFDNLADEIGDSFWLKNNDLRGKLNNNQKPFRLLRIRLDTPLPPNTLSLARVFLLEQWKEILESPDPCLNQVQQMIKFSDGISLDSMEFRSVYELKLKQLILQIKEFPYELERLDRLNSILSLLDSVPMKINLWNAQNEIFEIIKSHYQAMQGRKCSGDKEAGEWVNSIETALNYLNICPPQMVAS